MTGAKYHTRDDVGYSSMTYCLFMRLDENAVCRYNAANNWYIHNGYNGRKNYNFYAKLNVWYVEWWVLFADNRQEMILY